MNNKQLDVLIRSGNDIMKAIDDGLYFRLARGKASWVVKYSLRGKRAQIALPNAYPQCSISQAKQEALRIRANVKLGIDPKIERKRHQQPQLRTVNDVFNDWYDNDLKKNLSHPDIPKRIYAKEIKKHIGSFAVADVTPTDISEIIRAVLLTDRPSIANKTVMHLKQLFKHALKLNLITYNPAGSFTQKDAAGALEHRTRHLSLEEIGITFKTLNEHNRTFTRYNYLACCLLILLGVRKGELISAKWEHFDIPQRLWHMPKDNKTKTAITIPLPEIAIEWLKELHIQACGSDYVFPSKKAGNSQSHISRDTLNHALERMFGKQNQRTAKPAPNYLGLAGIEHFTIHDLRRTCRSQLAKLGIPYHIAERCLNHKIKNIEDVYNQHDYLDERRDALNLLADTLTPLIHTQMTELK